MNHDNILFTWHNIKTQFLKQIDLSNFCIFKMRKEDVCILLLPKWHHMTGK